MTILRPVLVGLGFLLASCASPVSGEQPDLAGAAAQISPEFDPDNLIARSVRGEGGVPIVYDDGRAVAFLIDRPAARGHFIVALRDSSARIFLELDDAETLAVMRAAQRVAAAEVEVLGAEGFTLRQNNGSASSVPQYHLHVVPRWAGDSIPPGIGPATDMAQVEADAALIRAALAR